MSSKNSHVATMNGERHMFLDDYLRSYKDQIRRELGLLGSKKYISWSLWRAPEVESVMDIDLKAYPREFMQSAGTAEAMTVEVRRVEDDGVARQYAVGRPDGGRVGEPSVAIALANGHETKVFPNEVFNADEAADIYYQYFLTDKVPEPYVLRRLDFSQYE